MVFLLIFVVVVSFWVIYYIINYFNNIQLITTTHPRNYIVRYLLGEYAQNLHTQRWWIPFFFPNKINREIILKAKSQLMINYIKSFKLHLVLIPDSLSLWLFFMFNFSIFKWCKYDGVIAFMFCHIEKKTRCFNQMSYDFLVSKNILKKYSLNFLFVLEQIAELLGNSSLDVE